MPYDRGQSNKIGKLDGIATKVGVADIRKWLTNPVEIEKTLDHPTPHAACFSGLRPAGRGNLRA